ncbi:MAG: SLC13 family permease [Verrucomicrobiae bacterium]|nr:SLC13 family permease [Verrucomicrobiae bacterium]
MNKKEPSPRNSIWFLGLFLGLLSFLLTLILPPPQNFSLEAWHTLGVGLWMAIWWMLEIVPLAVTALLPLVLMPLLGVRTVAQTASDYGDPLIFLFLSGFLMAQAMQRWGLHERLALSLIMRTGTKPAALVGGFMVATAFLSMWVSNTATAMMMYPIGVSTLNLLKNEKGEFRDIYLPIALMLSIAYAANIGGVATLIGTPPNVMAAAFIEKEFHILIPFWRWMLFGFPLAVCLLVFAYFLLTRWVFTLSKEEIIGVREHIREQIIHLGPVRQEEKAVAAVLGIVVFLWLFKPVLGSWIASLSDTVIALMGVITLFLWPVDLKQKKFLLSREALQAVPWEVLILFGGGLSLAASIESSQLTVGLSQITHHFRFLPSFLLFIFFAGMALLLSELASNTATVAVLLPIVSSFAVGLGDNPLPFMIAIALAASCAFMMPVGTPPNAIIFGSGWVEVKHMVRAGFWLNLAALTLITAIVLIAF